MLPKVSDVYIVTEKAQMQGCNKLNIDAWDQPLAT